MYNISSGRAQHSREFYVKQHRETGKGSYLYVLLLAESVPFRFFSILVIVTNMVVMGFKASEEVSVARGDDRTMVDFFSKVEYGILAWFVIEVTVRLIGCPMKVWADKIL